MAEQEVKAVTDAVKELTSVVNALNAVVNTLNVSVAVMTSNVKKIREVQDDHETRLRTVEAMPTKKWDKAVGALIGALITGTVALLFATLQK
jgi:hypothetical protein